MHTRHRIALVILVVVGIALIASPPLRHQAVEFAKDLYTFVRWGWLGLRDWYRGR